MTRLHKAAGAVGERAAAPDPQALPADLARHNRAREYPALGDAVDALMDAVAALAAGKPIPPHAAALMAQRQATKAKYPKADPGI